MGNRNNILASALHLFATEGYDTVSVQRIVEAAGVTKPTLYYYFKSKQRLLKTLLQEHFDILNDMLKPALAYHGDLSLSLSSLATAYFSFIRAHQDFYRLQLALYFMAPGHEAHKASSAIQDKQYAQVVKLFKQAAQNEPDLKGHHEYCAVTFLGMIEQWAALALNGHVRLDSTLVHQTVHQFLYGIYSTEPKKLL